MANIKVLGEQLNIVDVANDIAADSTAISSIATGVTSDPSAAATLGADYLRRDGVANTMLADLDVGGFDVINVNLVDGRSVSADGTALDNHVLLTGNPHGTNISDLSDVIVTGSPAAVSGDSLVFDGTDWVNQPITTSTAIWGQISGTLSDQTDLQAELDLKADQTSLDTHTGTATGNPHAVTQTEVGLPNVDNTADADKPISTLTQTALDTKFDGTFNVKILPNIGLLTNEVGSENVISYALSSGNPPLPDGTPVVLLGDPGAAMNIASPFMSQLILRNNISVGAYDDTHTTIKGLISRTDTTVNTAPIQGPVAYNNEVIVGDSGVTTAIRSGTVGTNDPVVRAGVFGTTDDWKIWHEGNLDVSLLTTTASFNAHTATDNAHSVAIANLTDVALAGSPPTILNGQVLTWDNTSSAWINTTPSTGVTDHTLLSSIGTNTHVQIDTHIADAAIHFSSIDGLSDVDTTTSAPTSGQSLTWNGTDNWTPSDIDHDSLTNNGGAGSHTTISNHMATSSIHFSVIEGLSNVVISGATDGQVLSYDFANTQWINADAAAVGVTDHTLLSNIGTNTHTQIDTHISDATIHFTESSIDHVNILNKGTNTHAQIDTHIADITNPHATAVSNLSDVVVTGSPAAVNGDVLTFDGVNWINLPSSGGAIVLDDLTDVDTTTIAPTTAGEVLAYDGAGLFVNRVLVEADITDLQAYLLNINSESINGLSDVIITTAAANNGLIFDGTNWINQTIDHVTLGNIGTNTHAQIDTHIADTANPHNTSVSNLTDVAATVPTSDQVFTYNFTNSNWEPRDLPASVAAAPQYEKQIIVGNVTTVVTTTIPTTAYAGGKATLQVFRNGALQEENISGAAITTEDFDVTGATEITFANALIDADKIIIYAFE